MADLDLSWDAVNWNGDQGHYNVFRATSSGTSRSDYTDIADVASGTTSYTDTGLDEGEQYFYRVDAENSAGTSGLSNEASAVTNLPAPSSLSATAAGPHQIDLSWTDNAADEHGYRVYRGQSSGNLSQVADLAANTTSYSDTGLVAARTYYYEVRAYTEHTESASSEVSATTDPVTETGVFTNASASTQSPNETTRTTIGANLTTASASPFATETGRTTVGASKTEASASPFSTEIASTIVGASIISASASPTGVSEQAVANETGFFTNASASTLSASVTSIATETDVFTEASASPFSSETIFADRVATLTGEGSVDSAAELSEVFPSESSADLSFSLITDPVLGFASEWVYEDSNIDDTAAFSLILDIRFDTGFDVRVQYDADGDGTADYTTDPVHIFHDQQTVSFPELGDEGYYRIIISGLRPNDFLRAVTWGPTTF